MIKNRWSRRAVMAAVLAGAVATGASAQSAEDFYTGKTLTVVVASATGSASDFFARQVAPYLTKYMPGHPDVLVLNEPGAGGLKEGMLLQQRGPFDGSTIALLQSNNFTAPILDDGIAFRPREMSWLGSLNSEVYTVVARSDAPVKTYEDLFTTPLILGATSYQHDSRMIPAMMNEYMGTKFDIVTGYEGNAAVGLALERGEVEARMQTANTLLSGEVRHLVEAGELTVVAQAATRGAKEFPDLKNMIDFATDDLSRGVANFILSPLVAGRPFAAPAGVPEDRIEALREAFDKAAADPEFLAGMEQLNAQVNYVSGTEVQQIVQDLWDAKPEVVEAVKTLATPPS
ncbi:Bug family tripartite tricarboxylate transporter substrate binding protein [Salipiger sp.]|uniref:Bug family tripartite tricarboxylate transporter substrate binding protein n=1 Tax=Salipiger sp. TaxID=2078585 RepID=UPI003A982704